MEPTEQFVDLATGKVRLLQAGTGQPLLVVHHDIGNTGWLPFHEALSQRFSLYLPDLPGFGGSDRPDWARHPRDLAIITLQLIEQLGLERIALVGLGFGGWVAAEMATMNQRLLRSLVLVCPVGIKPDEGEIADQMLMTHNEYVMAGLPSPAFESNFGDEIDAELRLALDLNKEMTARVAWKPYMFSYQLPPLLGNVPTPSLIVWGRDDVIVPASCGDLYAAALPNSRLVTLEETGHFIEMQRPSELADLIVNFNRD